MKKRELSFWEIWNMSFGFLGIQFGFALQNANTSRIFETLGARIDDIPILWIAAPVTGLIVQPIVGYFSDRTWTRLGRRRPYFLFGAILASLALVIMPNSPTLWMAAGMLWIMDASINISMEPFRAFVGDNLPNQQRTRGFAMQSFFIGVGAVVGSVLPFVFTNWFGISNVAAAGEIPDSVKWSYYVGAVAFITAVGWTVFTSREYTPTELTAFEESEPEITTTPPPPDVEGKLRKAGLMTGSVGVILTFILWGSNLEKELYILSLGLTILGALFLAALWIRRNRKEVGFTTIMVDLIGMPTAMKQLAWVQFFSWFALFSMWIYTTQAVTEHIYQTTDTTSVDYNTGANQVGEMFANYNIIAAAVAFLLPLLAKATSRKFTHFLALVAGGLGLMSIYFISNPSEMNLEWLPMIGVGIAWASILSIPYAMLSGVLPASKMGYYMGVFNFFIVIPQLVAASILGFM